MNKDIKNVAISFALIIGVTVTSSILYSNKAEAEQLFTKREEEYLERERIGQQAMQLFLLQKTMEEANALVVIPENEVEKTDAGVAPTSSLYKAEIATSPSSPKPTQNVVVVPVQTQNETNSATAEAQKKAQADALAQQIAQAKAAAAAEAAAQQVAAEAAAKKKAAANAARQSSAS